MKLKGKTAIVTGVAQGIGKAIALKLAEEGANLAVMDLNEARLSDTVYELTQKGTKAKAYTVDMRNVEQIRTSYQAVGEDFESVDIAVHAAGVAIIQHMWETTEKDWDFVMDVNAKAVYFCVQQAAQQMKKFGGGRIINLASIAGKSPTADNAIYSASKAAVISISKSAATAFANDGIKVNAICPGFVHTAMWDLIDQERARIHNQQEGEAIEKILGRIPLKRKAELEEVAGLVSYLSSPEADYITGQSINICGGLVMD